jgi:hypothetical protein
LVPKSWADVSSLLENFLDPHKAILSKLKENSKAMKEKIA